MINGERSIGIDEATAIILQGKKVKGSGDIPVVALQKPDHLMTTPLV